MERTVIGLDPFEPFIHFKQTPMQVVRHIKFITYENHKYPNMVQENETIAALAGNELLDYH